MHHKKQPWLGPGAQMHGDDYDMGFTDIGADLGAETAAAAQPKGSKLLGALKQWWAKRHTMKAPSLGAATMPRARPTAHLNQRITSNLTDSDNELEALQSAAQNDPYALGQPL